MNVNFVYTIWINNCLAKAIFFQQKSKYWQMTVEKTDANINSIVYSSCNIKEDNEHNSFVWNIWTD